MDVTELCSIFYASEEHPTSISLEVAYSFEGCLFGFLDPLAIEGMGCNPSVWFINVENYKAIVYIVPILLRDE
jgi:hypothetical protein